MLLRGALAHPGYTGPAKLFSSSLTDEEWSYTASEVPQEILLRINGLRKKKKKKKSLISPLEELVMAAPFLTPELQSTLRGRDILHFADNQGANRVAIKGYSSAPDFAVMRIALLQTRWWISFVASAANPADALCKATSQSSTRKERADLISCFHRSSP